MRFHAERIDALTDGADLFLSGVRLHDYEHGRVLFWCAASVMERGLGGKARGGN
jgi:hypothetical protein